MTDMADFLFVDDDNEDFLHDEPEAPQIYRSIGESKWKILVVDDEPEVHRITRLVLNKFQFEGRGLELIEAYSGEEAKRLAKDNPDLAMILLDVVMEEDDSGLKVVQYVREVLQNKSVRIVLRTGQPGQAPEERIIIDYDINDYKDKTELTSQKLFTEMIASLRAYRDITTIDTNRAALRKILESYETIFKMSSLKEFTEEILIQLAEILMLNNKETGMPSGFAAISNNGDYDIISAIGGFKKAVDKKARLAMPVDITEELDRAYASSANLYYDDKLVISLKSKAGSECILYFEDNKKLSMLEKSLIEVFCTNIAAVNESIVNRSRYESEKEQRQLIEAQNQLTQKLTSTFDLQQVIKRLMDTVQSIVQSDGVAVVMQSGGTNMVVVAAGECAHQVDEEIAEDSYEHSVLQLLEKNRSPLLLGDVHSCMYLLKEGSCDSEMCSLLALPIMHRDEAAKENFMGAVLLWRSAADSFKRRDKDIVETFVNQGVVAIVNAKLFTEVVQKRASIKNLLNNAKQGFLSFDSSLLVDAEYSSECECILGENIEGRRITELLFAGDEVPFWEDVLKSVFNENEACKRDIVMSLLPKEGAIGERTVEIDYKLIDETDKRIMTIITDITDKKTLEINIDRERKILQMVVNIIKHHDDFINSLRDYKMFCSTISETVRNSRSLDAAVSELFRSVHTYKGTFSQLGLAGVTAKLHTFETKLTELKVAAPSIDKHELIELFESMSMEAWLNEDLDILSSVLGEQFIYKDKLITIQQSRLLDIEEKLGRLGTHVEYMELLSDIRRLRYKPFKELLAPYPEYISRLAERMEKLIKAFTIEGGDFEIDNDKYGGFAKSLVHVFRNAIDHGLENYEERLLACKEESGTIRCSISHDGFTIRVTISDDGRGLDIERIRQQAKEKGLASNELLNTLSKEELLMLIFEDGFSTSNDVSELSGRGFGLAAVKEEVNKLGGSIWINTESGKGTVFNFLVPYEE